MLVILYCLVMWWPKVYGDVNNKMENVDQVSPPRAGVQTADNTNGRTELSCCFTAVSGGAQWERVRLKMVPSKTCCSKQLTRILTLRWSLSRCWGKYFQTEVQRWKCPLKTLNISSKFCFIPQYSCSKVVIHASNSGNDLLFYKGR